MNTHQSVVVGMSGGVDSSVAALLLKEQGYDVTGVMLNLWTAEGCEDSNRCCAPEAQATARNVSHELGIPFYVLDAKEEFFKKIVLSFLESIRSGYTPNPCWQCNSQLRWEMLLGFARKIHANLVSTGHYARIIKNNGISRLFCGVDKTKDQSYVLSGLTQEQLKNTLFPLGELKKEEVRRNAKQFGLINWEEPDSQDLCFTGELQIDGFLRTYASATLIPGEIVDVDGTVLGQHRGLGLYTIGQRKGIRISGKEPYYVIAKNVPSNQLIIGRKTDAVHNSFILKSMNWIVERPLENPFNARVMIRYRSHKHEALVSDMGNNSLRVSGKTTLDHITPGQIGVLYNDDEVMGGGIIDSFENMQVQ
jgi:tRNA-specific 2-thiouridylase